MSRITRVSFFIASSFSVCLLIVSPLVIMRLHREYILAQFVCELDVSREGNLLVRLEIASREIQEAGLQEEALTAVLPLLKRRNASNLGARLYIVNCHPTEREDVKNALLEMAVNTDFYPEERIDSAQILCLLAPNEGQRTLALRLIDRAKRESQATPSH